MENVVKDELKQISISHSIVQACRPCSVISPVLFGVGVELDHLYRSKFLVDECARLGFSISSDEVSRYKQSVIRANANEQSLQAYPKSFTQWIADNVDHNIVTLDGQGTFHGMGIIAASTRTSRSIHGIEEEVIVRQRRQNVNDVVKNHGIEIKLYHPPEKSGLALLKFKPTQHLQLIYTLPASLNFDLLWNTCWFFKEETCLKANWSGFMQHVCCTGSHPLPADIIMLPIVDLNPSDSYCSYSTLCFVEQQARQLDIVSPCITFDQPLWLKATEIITASNMNMVCRLGGFHTLMSFLGSIGSLMGGSGLTEALETCYGTNAVIHMISGKAVARALRGHFLIDAALLVKLMKRVLASDKSNTATTSDSDEVGEDEEDVAMRNVERLTSCDMDDLKTLFEVIASEPENADADGLDFTPVSRLERSIESLKNFIARFFKVTYFILYQLLFAMKSLSESNKIYNDFTILVQVDEAVYSCSHVHRVVI